MAILYSYPITETVKTTDQFVLSVAPSAGVGAFQTNSITYGTLRDSIIDSALNGADTYIPVFDGTNSLVNSVLKQDQTTFPSSLTVAQGITFSVTNNATVGGTLDVTGNTTINAGLDVHGNVKIIGEKFEFNFDSSPAHHIFSIVPSTTSSGLGSSSLSFGKGNASTKGNSVAMGQNLTADGNESQAFGFGSSALGTQSLATGSSNIASGAQSASFGNGTVASGSRAISAGFETTSSGLNSLSLGNSTTASGNNSIAAGVNSQVSGFNSFVFGNNLDNQANSCFVCGTYNEDRVEYNFAVGTGTDGNRKNGLAVTGVGHIIAADLGTSNSYANDIEAAVGGVPLYGLYRNGNLVQIRLS